MKHGHNHHYAPSAVPHMRRVCFDFKPLADLRRRFAREVKDGDGAASPTHLVDGDRSLDQTGLALATPGGRRVVNSRWVVERLPTDSASKTLGRTNSISEVAGSAEEARLADLKAPPLKNANQQKAQTR